MLVTKPSICTLLHQLLSVAAVAFFSLNSFAHEMPHPSDQPILDLLHSSTNVERDSVEAEIDAEVAKQLMTLGYIDSSVTIFESDGVVVSDVENSYSGINLYLSAHAAEAFLIDMEGNELHRWHLDADQLTGAQNPPHLKGSWPAFWRKVHLLPDGDLLAIHEGFGLVRLDRYSNVRWIRGNGAHHDLWETDDGRVFILSRTLIYDERLRTNGPILNDHVIEVDQGGETLRSFSILDSLILERQFQLLNLAEDLPGDPMHCNSIQVVSDNDAIPAEGIQSGDFIISCRTIDAIFSLSPKTGLVSWASQGRTSKQHDAQLVEGGRLTVFDNGDQATGSRAVVLDLFSLDRLRSWPTGKTPNLFSRCCGTTQLLPNGNLLTTFTEESLAVETDQAGSVVWEFRNPHGSVYPGRTIDKERAMLYEVERINPDYDWTWLESMVPQADNSTSATSESTSASADDPILKRKRSTED